MGNHKQKDSEFKPPVQIENIGGFTKADMDLVNQYSKLYGYHPDFKTGLLYDKDRCHSVQMIKKDGRIFANIECISENYRLLKLIQNSSLSKNISGSRLGNVFGIISLAHS